MDREPKPRSQLPPTVWWLILAWIAITVGAASWGLSNEQNDLTDRATAALTGSGLTIEFAGRDATIVGTAADQSSLDQAIATIRNLRGVRRVDAPGALAAPPPDPEIVAPASTTTPPSTTQPQATEPPQFSVRYQRSTIELSGSLPDGETIDAIVAAAESRYGAANVINNLTTGENVDAPSYLARLPRIFELVGRLNPWTLTLDEGVVTLGGLGGGRDAIEQLGAAFDDFAKDFEGFENELEVNPNAVAASVTELLAGGANFETGSADLSQDAITRLDAAVEILLANPSARLRAEGHTDNVGTAAANLALSLARAQAVVDYLVAGGVDPDRLTVIGHGEERPLASNDTEEGRAMNRRIEFTVRDREES